MPNRAARLAGISIIAIGVALLAWSTWYSVKALTDRAWLDAQLADAGPALQDHPLLQPEVLTGVVVVAGILGLLEAGLSVVLGIYTYRGKRWAIVTSIVVTVLRLLIVGLLLLFTLLAAALVETAATGSQTPASMSRHLLFAGGAALVLLALIGLLIAALRSQKEGNR